MRRRRRLLQQEQRQQGRQAQRGGDHQDPAAHHVDQQAERQRRRGLRHSRRRADDAEPIAIILRAEHRQRQGAARNGQDAVAGAMKNRERACRGAADQPDDGGADRMRQARQPGRNQRMIAAEKARLEDAGGDLRRADQRAGGHRLQRRRAGGFQNPRQVRGHRAGDGPGRREGERQQDHGAIDRDLRLDGCRDRRLGALHRGQHEEVERQADQDMRERPGKAGVAPADGFEARAPSAASRPCSAKPASSVMPVIERRAASP